MPNWTFNRISINGKNEDIELFLSDANKHENGMLSFASWIPVPDTFKKYDTTNYPNGNRLVIGQKVHPWEEDSPIVTPELIEEYKAATKLQMEQYGFVGWYAYNCETYGCKWDAEISVESRTVDQLIMSCSTAWVAPMNFILSISERYPNLSIEVGSYYEEGLYTEYLVEKGKAALLKKEEYDWDDEDEEDDEEDDEE